MDGLKKYLNESIQLKLAFVLLLVITLVAVTAGAFSFVSALSEAHERQDDVLYQVAGLMNQLPAALVARHYRSEDSDNDSAVFIQSLSGRNSSSGRGAKSRSLALPTTLHDGLHTLDINDKTYRVLVKTDSAGKRFAVAQDTNQRDETAENGALWTLMPFLILVPILLVIVVSLLRRMFRPIKYLSREVNARSEQNLQPIEEAYLPTEVRPFIRAINRLLAKVAESMETQRRFVADAAHELRSPLTALSLQAEHLEQAQMSDFARERLAKLRLGIERNRKLLNQLLALAKAQAANEPPNVAVSVLGVYRRVLEDLMPLAAAKQVDIGVVSEGDVQLWVAELDLLTLVKNLVDNAIRYTPQTGRVDLSVKVERDAVVLSVSDTGRGVPVRERARILDPFYRVLGSEQEGSGLGLSIVKAVAERIGAHIKLDYTDAVGQSGLTVSIVIPPPRGSLVS